MSYISLNSIETFLGKHATIKELKRRVKILD